MKSGKVKSGNVKSGGKILGDEAMEEECSSRNIGVAGQKGVVRQFIIIICNMAENVRHWTERIINGRPLASL